MQIRQCIYIGYYKSNSKKLKIGETQQKAINRARSISKQDFRILWFGELQFPKKGYGQYAENVLREYFIAQNEVKQISADHFEMMDRGESAKNYIKQNILDIKEYLRENDIKISHEEFKY
jgi:hypothetical protein